MAGSERVRRIVGHEPQQAGAPRFRAARPMADRSCRPPSSTAASRRPKPPSAASASPSPSMATRKRPSGSSRSTSSRASSPRANGRASRPGSSSGCARSTPSSTTSTAPAGSSPTASIPADIVLGNPQYCIPCRRRPAAARRLRPYLRDRPGAHRRRRILGARGQCPHALGRLLHARESRGDAAALPGIVRRRFAGPAGRFLSRAAARDAAIRSRRAARASRSACC